MWHASGQGNQQGWGRQGEVCGPLNPKPCMPADNQTQAGGAATYFGGSGSGDVAAVLRGSRQHQLQHGAQRGARLVCAATGRQHRARPLAHGLAKGGCNPWSSTGGRPLSRQADHQVHALAQQLGCLPAMLRGRPPRVLQSARCHRHHDERSMQPQRRGAVLQHRLHLQPTCTYKHTGGTVPPLRVLPGCQHAQQAIL